MSFFKPFPPLLRGWLFSLLGFSLLTVAVGAQLGRFTTLTWTAIFWIGVRDWLPLMLVTPLLFRVIGRLPVEREHWKLAVPVQIVLCFAVMSLCRWWRDDVVPPSMIWSNASRGESRPPEPPRDAPAPDRPGRQRPGGPSPWRPIAFFGPSGMQLTLYLVMVSVAHALHFYRRSQDRERRSLELSGSLAQARLSALRMQLQPHFLFNSLNAISALVHKDADAADEMIGALSDFLRLTLESSGEQEVPLARELEFVERYLAIEKVRFGERLQFAIDAPDETLTAMVPALVLQPIVENSIRHGLAPRVDTGEVSITARRENGVLRMTVHDNGGGFGPKQQPDGVGLGNTRARLRELYGVGSSLVTEDRDGAVVTITVPFRPSHEVANPDRR